jgi:hypothetical protein
LAALALASPNIAVITLAFSFSKISIIWKIISWIVYRLHFERCTKVTRWISQRLRGPS